MDIQTLGKSLTGIKLGFSCCCWVYVSPKPLVISVLNTARLELIHNMINETTKKKHVLGKSI